MAVKRLSLSTRNGVLDDLATAFNDGIIELKSGTMPTDPDAAISDTNLGAVITVDGGAFVAGAPGNGLGWEAAAAGTVAKATAETWKDSDVNQTCVVTHAILYDNSYDKTLNPTGRRIILDVSTSGAAVTMANTSITAGGEAVVSSCQINFAQS